MGTHRGNRPLHRPQAIQVVGTSHNPSIVGRDRVLCIQHLSLHLLEDPPHSHYCIPRLPLFRRVRHITFPHVLRVLRDNSFFLLTPMLPTRVHKRLCFMYHPSLFLLSLPLNARSCFMWYPHAPISTHVGERHTKLAVFPESSFRLTIPSRTIESPFPSTESHHRPPPRTRATGKCSLDNPQNIWIDIRRIIQRRCRVITLEQLVEDPSLVDPGWAPARSVFRDPLDELLGFPRVAGVLEFGDDFHDQTCR